MWGSAHADKRSVSWCNPFLRGSAWAINQALSKDCFQSPNCITRLMRCFTKGLTRACHHALVSREAAALHTEVPCSTPVPQKVRETTGRESSTSAPKSASRIVQQHYEGSISVFQTQVWRTFWVIWFFDAEHPCKMFMFRSEYVPFYFCVHTRSILLSK